MCGRFTLHTPVDKLVKQFWLNTIPELRPRYNIAPTQLVPIVRSTNNNPSRQLDFVQWGLVPSWAKAASIGNRMINARQETVAEKPSFRIPFKRQRCLVIADGYYEWKRTGKEKQPYYIRLSDNSTMAFAGLWESWNGPAHLPLDKPLESCTIITTAANTLTRPIHDRMPVILSPDHWDAWLNLTLLNPKSLLPLLQPYNSDDLVADPVSRYVNSPAHDDATCITLRQET